jgi:hypothetical protein
MQTGTPVTRATIAVKNMTQSVATDAKEIQYNVPENAERS